MGEGTKVIDTDIRVDALAKRLEKLEHRVLELEWYKQYKTDGAVAYTAKPTGAYSGSGD